MGIEAMLAVLHLVHEREHLRGDELHLLERRLRLLEAALELPERGGTYCAVLG